MKFFVFIFAVTFCAMIGANQLPQPTTLTWQDNSDNEDGFNIERREFGGDFIVIGQVGADEPTYIDRDTEEGGFYEYRVNAYNAFGSSGYTNIASHTTGLFFPTDVTVTE